MKLDRKQVGRLALACGLITFAWVLLRTAWLCDDAYISFRVVENAVAGYGLRWNIADRVQVFTHPLWMLLHIPFRAVTGEIYYTSLALCAAASLGAVWQLAGRAASTVQAGVLAAALSLSSKAFVDYSTSGLENPLTHLLLVLFFVAGLREGDAGRTFLAQTFIAGLLIVNRLDALLLVLPALAISAWRLGIRRAWKPALSGFSVSALWFAFATVYYGSPFPNTALAKLGAGIELGEMLGLGVRYAIASLREDPLTLLTVFAALLVAAWRRRHVAIAGGVALYLLYILRIGGDFMGGRFFTAPFVLAVAILVREASSFRAPRVLAGAAVIVILGLLPAGAPLTSGPEYGRDRASLIDPYGIADERAYYFRSSGLWNGAATTLPRDDKWLEATTARECNFPLVIVGAIGFYGYEAGPTVHILDYNALADPVLSRLPAVDEDRLYLDWYRNLEGREPATRRRIGHFLRNIPSGYVSYLLGDGTKFESDEMRRHVETVTAAVREPLWSRDRIGAALELAVGKTTAGLRGPELRKFRPIPIGEVLASGSDPVFTSTIRGCATMNTDPASALDALRVAVAGCDANGLALRCLGGAARLTGALDEALRAHHELVAQAPEADWVHYELGRTLLMARQPNDAIDSFKHALDLNRWNIDARRGLASAHASLGDFGAAADDLERAVALRPNRARLWRELAEVRERADDPDGAAAARAEASRLDR
ncbi:MAG: tetratricopeptide repeat protein [Acidobacteria bacterium]|nr:MAG: tetratricopeptide repeat protein [Acidobacteriota bacterium]